jgi:hypothetical protein
MHLLLTGIVGIVGIVVQEHACLMLSDKAYQGLLQRVFCVQDDNDSNDSNDNNDNNDHENDDNRTDDDDNGETASFRDAETYHRLDTGLPRPV